MTSGRLADAISHAQAALKSLEARIAELKEKRSSAPTTAPETPAVDSKGKGKAASVDIVKRDDVDSMTASQIDAEIKDLTAIHEDLQLKVCTPCSFFDIVLITLIV
jgi:HAT1-interacting factor 1